MATSVRFMERSSAFAIVSVIMCRCCVCVFVLLCVVFMLLLLCVWFVLCLVGGRRAVVLVQELMVWISGNPKTHGARLAMA